MAIFPKDINFKFPWRPYQKRILDDLDKHLDDRQLHIVAPPGSGKTVLGLEVTKRLNQPTLILAPTITIRNQWADRLRNDFLEKEPFNNIAFEVKNPDLLTISTYQGLHVAFKNNPEEVLENLKKVGLKILVVDECHHLKNEWWKTLFQIKDALDLTIIALTATPPFDVSGTEWQRYRQLCGEVDAEINVAELVAENNLCPHQDYIYFSMPTNDESIEITRFHNEVNDFIDTLKNNYTFRDWIKEHPFLQEPQANLDAIYETPDYFSSLLIVNEFFNGSVPIGTVEILGGDIENLPNLDENWLQLFLNQALFKDPYFEQFAKIDTFKNIHKKLKKIGAIERKKIVLTEPDNINKKLRLSTSKLNSITTIVDHEWKTLRDDLRMVILTDYIRKEEMPTSELDIKNQEKIGVVPIFERLRKQFPIEINLGILSGSLVVIPTFAVSTLEQIINAKNLNVEQLSTSVLPQDKHYVTVETKGDLRTKIVEIITELFTQGGITVLVGTKSLLGEGWDAPAVNSLVLATFVGSYVLSNQMRGRAIRTQKGNDNKTANIWHLVCLDPTDKYGGHDFRILKRRFKAFHGVGFSNNPMIENGMNRFHLPNFPIDKRTLDIINNQMLGRADNRERLRLDWEKALKNGMWMVEEIKLPIVQQKSYKRVRSNVSKTISTGFYMDLEAIRQAIKFSPYISAFLAIGIYCVLPTWIFLLLNVVLAVMLLPMFQSLKFYKPIVETYDYLIEFFPNTKSKTRSFLLKMSRPFIITIIFSVLSFIYFEWIVSVSIFIFLMVNINADSFRFRESKLLKTTQNPVYNIILNEESFIKNIGKTILQTLVSSGYLLQSDYNKFKIKTTQSEFGEVTCYLENASSYHNELFLEALNEVLNPIENPRYLLRMDRDMVQKYDTPFYATIPTLLSKKKSDAKSFSVFWNENIALNDLVYTRFPDGRLELLKARGLSLNPDLHPKAERVSAWR